MKKGLSRSACARCRHSWLSFLPILWISMMIIEGAFSLRAATADELADLDMEYRIKAAFLLNFCKFVSWPDTPLEKPGAPIILYAIGQNPFKSALETIAGKTVKERPLEIRFASNPDEVGSCHLLFVGNSDSKELATILAGVDTKPVLTVGDMEDFARRGGMIAFVKIDGKIRFEINPKLVEAAGLKISSQLLKLAVISGGNSDGTREKEN